MENEYITSLIFFFFNKETQLAFLVTIGNLKQILIIPNHTKEGTLCTEYTIFFFFKFLLPFWAETTQQYLYGLPNVLNITLYNYSSYRKNFTSKALSKGKVMIKSQHKEEDGKDLKEMVFERKEKPLGIP